MCTCAGIFKHGFPIWQKAVLWIHTITTVSLTLNSSTEGVYNVVPLISQPVTHSLPNNEEEHFQSSQLGDMTSSDGDQKAIGLVVI